jgi:hypothetical protein
LNSYGQAYRDSGRSQQAIRDIEGLNSDQSDKDIYSNLEEIKTLTFPGDPNDYPGLTPAPAVGMNLERILRLPDHSQFLLHNASKDTDWYARYRGVKVKDLLKYAGVRKEAAQITVFAPDGFSKTFLIDAPDPQTSSSIQYDVIGPYPQGYYFGGLDFVNYSFIPNCLNNGDRIPDKLYMLLAYLRDGDPLNKGKLVFDPDAGKWALEGEGPYRLIPPQKIAGSPDQPSTANPTNYDPTKDHNAGFSIRSVAAIRVEPLPDGTTDFNWYEGGWNLVDGAKLVIYGAIDPRTYRVSGRVSNGNGEGIPDVKLAFSLLSLGQVGEATTSSGRGHFKKRFGSGRFHIDLPVGEYTVIPSKEGCTFTPASLSISIPDPECDLDRDHWDPWDHRDRWEHCNRHPENEIKIIATCSQ